jgi:hypothetical protein
MLLLTSTHTSTPIRGVAGGGRTRPNHPRYRTPPRSASEPGSPGFGRTEGAVSDDADPAGSGEPPGGSRGAPLTGQLRTLPCPHATARRHGGAPGGPPGARLAGLAIGPRRRAWRLVIEHEHRDHKEHQHDSAGQDQVRRHHQIAPYAGRVIFAMRYPRIKNCPRHFNPLVRATSSYVETTAREVLDDVAAARGLVCAVVNVPLTTTIPYRSQGDGVGGVVA